MKAHEAEDEERDDTDGKAAEAVPPVVRVEVAVAAAAVHAAGHVEEVSS